MSNKVELRPILEDSYEILKQKINQTHDLNLLFQAFCGIGKSRAIYKTLLDSPYLTIQTIF